MAGERLITWGVGLLLGLIALWLVRAILQPPLRRQRMERRIVRSGVKAMHNVLLDDGMGGQSYFEWLLLTPTAIKILVTSGRRGNIFAGERMDSWAQIIGKRTVHFANPLYNLEESLSTLRYHLGKLPVEGRVLFVADCTFPKGRPERVLVQKELEHRRDKEAKVAVQPVLEQAWGQLQQKVRKVDPASEGYLLPLSQAPAYGRWLLLGLVSLGLVAWLYWRISG